MTDGIVMKSKRIIIPFQLQKFTQQQLHSNHIRIKKIRLLECELVCLVTMNVDIENTMKQCVT